MKIAITLSILLISSTTYSQHKSKTDNQKTKSSSWTEDNARTVFKKDYKSKTINHLPGTIRRLDNGAISTMAISLYYSS